MNYEGSKHIFTLQRSLTLRTFEIFEGFVPALVYIAQPNEIILPYVNEKRRDLKLSNEQPALLTFDNFRAQCTVSVLSLLDQPILMLH